MDNFFDSVYRYPEARCGAASFCPSTQSGSERRALLHYLSAVVIFHDILFP